MILLSLTDSSSRLLTGGKEDGSRVSVAVEDMMVRVKRFQIRHYKFESFLQGSDCDKIRNSRKQSDTFWQRACGPQYLYLGPEDPLGSAVYSAHCQ